LLEPQRADSPGAVNTQQYSPPLSIRATGHQLPFRNSHAELIGLCRGGLATTDILLLCFGGFGGNTNRQQQQKHTQRERCFSTCIGFVCFLRRWWL
jgi:hypothetical protein